MDWITGEKFRSIADFTYFPNKELPDNYYNLVNTLDLSNLKDVNIVYTNTNAASYFLNVIRHFKQKFILITHSCDCRIEVGEIIRPDGSGKEQGSENYTLPDNLIKWYSKNVNVINHRIESIPIGLENDRWFPGLRKKEKMLAKLSETRKYRNLAYLNVNPSTNPDERAPVISLLKNQSYVTHQQGSNGSNFDSYLDNIYNHKFVVCPEGNGIDTHRTWEALYMGTIPIEKRNLNNRFYKDLPICFVDNWNEITKDFLNIEFERIKSKQWNFKMLTFEYWEQKIKG